MGAGLGDTIIAATAAGGETALRIVGLFHTGLEQQDLAFVYLPLTKQQSMQARPRVVNEIHIRLADISRSISAGAGDRRALGITRRRRGRKPMRASCRSSCCRTR